MMRVVGCPACAVTMQPFFIEAGDLGPRVELDRCPKCTHLWFDVKELERASGRHFLPRQRGDVSPHSCPVCKVTLTASLVGGEVTIDECSQCNGAFLDPEQLEQLKGAPLRVVELEPPPLPPKKPARAMSRMEVKGFSCERCHQLTPYAEIGNVDSAAVCRSCELEPWPDQATWDKAERRHADWSDWGNTVGSILSRLLSSIPDD